MSILHSKVQEITVPPDPAQSGKPQVHPWFLFRETTWEKPPKPIGKYTN